MFTTNFGIEIEMTGITREKAAEVTAEHLNGRIARSYDGYDTHAVTAEDGRVWKLMSDASIGTQKKQGGRKVYADRSYSVELVSPILNYQDDIEN
ncbi:MAG: amidoligase family protein, partial [Anaerotignaceae bacterium]